MPELTIQGVYGPTETITKYQRCHILELSNVRDRCESDGRYEESDVGWIRHPKVDGA